MQKLRVIPGQLMDIHFINYPHGLNSRDFLKVTWILLHALDTILTYANSCLGLKCKNVVILRINLSPDGQNRWKFDMILPIFEGEGNFNKIQ